MTSPKAPARRGTRWKPWLGWTWVGVILLWMLSALSVPGAQGPIFAVQDALRREHVYFGERTGVLDEPTRSALRRFQVQRGLAGTGEVDAATLQALQSSAEARQPTIQSLPPAATGPVASEETVRKDREFLEKLEQADAADQATPLPKVSTTASVPMSTPEPVAEVLPESSAAAASRVSAPKTEKSRAIEKKRTAAAPARERSRPARTSERVVQEADSSDSAKRSTSRVTRAPEAPAATRESSRETLSATSAMPVRRALPVEPARKRGLFDRIFNDDDDDDD